MATTTPWGKATRLERAVLAQQAGGRRFSTVVELLETERGEPLVRVAYTTGGATRRGPVTLRTRDLDRLRRALERTPRLRAALLGTEDGSQDAR
jgi:hypothetical protein